MPNNQPIAGPPGPDPERLIRGKSPPPYISIRPGALLERPSVPDHRRGEPGELVRRVARRNSSQFQPLARTVQLPTARQLDARAHSFGFRKLRRAARAAA